VLNNIQFVILCALVGVRQNIGKTNVNLGNMLAEWWQEIRKWWQNRV